SRRLPLPRATLFPYTTLFRSARFLLKNPTAPARNAANRSRSRVETVSITTGRSGSSKLISAVAAMPSRHVDVHEHEVEPIRSKRSEEHTSELQSRGHLVCRLL